MVSATFVGRNLFLNLLALSASGWWGAKGTCLANVCYLARYNKWLPIGGVSHPTY